MFPVSLFPITFIEVSSSTSVHPHLFTFIVFTCVSLLIIVIHGIDHGVIVTLNDIDIEYDND